MLFLALISHSAVSHVTDYPPSYYGQATAHDSGPVTKSFLSSTLGSNMVLQRCVTSPPALRLPCLSSTARSPRLAPPN